MQKVQHDGMFTNNFLYVRMFTRTVHEFVDIRPSPSYLPLPTPPAIPQDHPRTEGGLAASFNDVAVVYLRLEKLFLDAYFRFDSMRFLAYCWCQNFKD